MVIQFPTKIGGHWQSESADKAFLVCRVASCEQEFTAICNFRAIPLTTSQHLTMFHSHW